MASPRRSSRPTLQEHLDRECGCSRDANPKGCLYQMFLDGWDYTPHAGNSQTRGEVFTPRTIVDYMIVQAGIMPKEIVYDRAYTSLADTHGKKALRLLRAKVYEPAVGTGNFISTILFHKLGLAHAAAMDLETGGFDLDEYHCYLLEAVGSCYASDIDPGNLQTTWWRILRDGAPISHKKAEDHWVNVIASPTHDPRSSLRAAAYVADDSAAYQRVVDHVQQSLALAQDNWSVLETDDGILEYLYKAHTSERLPRTIKRSINRILSHNLQLFDSLSITDTELCPGSENIDWYEWRFERGRLRSRILGSAQFRSDGATRPEQIALF